MLFALLAAALLVVATTFVHYEVLSALNAKLAGLRGGARVKVAFVILAAFVAHALEISIYGSAYFASSHWLQSGDLGPGPTSLLTCLYFSAETFTSLGFGDITPSGPIRLLAGVEALNGLLLIAWSASFTYLSMERFWARGATDGSRGNGHDR
jgi:hypothetical protein